MGCFQPVLVDHVGFRGCIRNGVLDTLGFVLVCAHNCLSAYVFWLVYTPLAHGTRPDAGR